MRETFLALGALLLITLAIGAAAADITVTTAADSGPGSLRDVVGKAPAGSVITFAIPEGSAGYDAATGKWTITLAIGQIKFRKPLTIRGGGAIILDGRGKSRIFNSDGSATLTLAGLTLQNGKAFVGGDYGVDDHGAGGSVASGGTVVASGCTFTNNMAEKAAGAIFSAHAVIIEDCAFTGNASGSFGGAVHVDKGAVVATGCAFIGNTADNGSALSADESIILTNCIFVGNSSMRRDSVSGAVRPAPTLREVARSLREDTATSGAVCADAVTATDCVFSNNTAQAGAAVSAVTFTAAGCVFTRNAADGTGGAASVSGALTARACAFTENSAEISGGAVFAGGKTTFSVSGCTFTGNTARNSGGAVSAGYSASATDCVFTGNTADKGGAISSIYAVVKRCAFTGNTVSSDGGAVHTVGVVSFLDCILTGNVAARNGGAVFTLGTVTAANSVFAGTRTGNECSGTIDTTGTAYLYHATVADNIGPGVYVRDAQSSPRLYAYNSVIAGNSAEVQAGFGFLSKSHSFPARGITGTSLIEGISSGVTRAAIFGDNAVGTACIIIPQAGGPADKTADALTEDSIAVPDGIKAADVITALRKDITGAPRPVSGKVSHGAKE